MAAPDQNTIPRIPQLIGFALVIIGAVGILVMLGVTVVSVFWRYVLSDPIFGLQDVTSMTSAVVVACAVSYGAVTNGHITVNIIPSHFGRKIRRLTDLVARASGAIILGLASYSLIKKGGCGLPCGQITSNLSIGHGPFYMVLAASMALFCLVLIIHIIVGLRNWRGDDPNEPVL